MKFFIWGMAADENFGVESLTSGACQLIKSIDYDASIIYSQPQMPSRQVMTDFEDLKISVIPSEGGMRLVLDAILLRFNLIKTTRSSFLNSIAEADIIADVYGIYFCNRFQKKYNGRVKAIKAIYQQFQVGVLGKILGKKVIKTAASFGPITQKQDIMAAKIASRFIFDRMYAREKESQNEIARFSNKQIFLSPDVANLIPYTKNNNTYETFGIVVSSQIVKKWEANESYISTIIGLIRHILKEYKMEIVLYPNEIHSGNPYNDLHLANEIASYFSEDKSVKVFDSRNSSHMEQRNSIASCCGVLSSRYHGCVAALSAGVPTIVVGWHIKYTELMELYNQSEYLLDQSTLSTELLIKTFEKMYKNKEAIQQEILEKKSVVVRSLYNAYREEFTK